MGCVRVEERVTMPHSINLTHPGSWGMITLGQYAFWPYMHREILIRTTQCEPCTKIGKNLTPVISASKLLPLRNCSETNEEIQLDFDGPITSENDQDIYLLASVDRFSKDPTVEIFDKANVPNLFKFLNEYIYKYMDFPEILG